MYYTILYYNRFKAGKDGNVAKRSPSPTPAFSYIETDIIIFPNKDTCNFSVFELENMRLYAIIYTLLYRTPKKKSMDKTPPIYLKIMLRFMRMLLENSITRCIV